MERMKEKHEQELIFLNQEVKETILSLDEEIELLKEQILEEEVWVDHLKEKEKEEKEEKKKEKKNQEEEEEKNDQIEEEKKKRRKRRRVKKETNALADRMTESSRKRREHLQFL